jgi:hypothetical protein
MLAAAAHSIRFEFNTNWQLRIEVGGFSRHTRHCRSNLLFILFSLRVLFYKCAHKKIREQGHD